MIAHAWMCPVSGSDTRTGWNCSLPAWTTLKKYGKCGLKKCVQKLEWRLETKESELIYEMQLERAYNSISQEYPKAILF
ncbi:hypothetical protein Tco_0814738 [Tanacetum coccineum]